MNEPRQIAANTFVLAGAKLLDRISTTLLALLVARMLGVAELGVYTAAMAYYGLIYVAASMGGTSYVIREVAKRPEETSRFLVHISVLIVIASSLVIALSIAIVPYLRYSSDMRLSVYLVLIGVAPGAINALQEATFVAHQRVAFVIYTSLIAALANVAVCIYLVFSGFGVVSLVAAFVIVQYVVCTCYFIFISSFITPLSCRFSISDAKRIFAEIKPFAGSSILSGFLSRPEVIFLSLLHNEAQLGFYSAAIKLADVWAMIPQIYMTNVFPVMSRSFANDSQKFAMIRDKSIKYLLAVCLPITVAMLVAAPTIIRIVYGQGFEAASPVLRVLAWNLPLLSIFSVTWRVLAARGEQGRVMRIQAAISTIRLAAGYPLVATLAAMGGAINVSGCMLLQNLVLIYYVEREGTRLRLLRLSWRFAAAAAAIGIAARLALIWVHFWVVAVLAILSYILAILTINAFASDDVELFRKALHHSRT